MNQICHSFTSYQCKEQRNVSLIPIISVYGEKYLSHFPIISMQIQHKFHLSQWYHFKVKSNVALVTTVSMQRTTKHVISPHLYSASLTKWVTISIIISLGTTKYFISPQSFISKIDQIYQLSPSLKCNLQPNLTLSPSYQCKKPAKYH